MEPPEEAICNSRNMFLWSEIEIKRTVVETIWVVYSIGIIKTVIFMVSSITVLDHTAVVLMVRWLISDELEDVWREVVKAVVLQLLCAGLFLSAHCLRFRATFYLVKYAW